MPPNYHPFLSRQINEALGDNPEISASVEALLQRISDSYSRFDETQKQNEAKVAHRTEQLIASTSQAYSFLDNLNMGFIMCDVNPEVVLTNNAVRHILSMKKFDGTFQSAPTIKEELTIDTIDSLLQPEIQLKGLIHDSLATNQPEECKEVNYGTRVLRLFIAPMVNESSQGEKQQIGIVILVEDITEQKILERSKDEFLSIASHELRTPLTAIRGNASMIQKYYGDKLPNKGTEEMIEDIHESAIRLIDIVNDFLDASSFEQGKIVMNIEAFSLDTVISDAMRDLKNICDPKGITLIKDPSVATGPTVNADRQRIKQVIYNLVGNAVKFTDAGTITISLQADDNLVYTTVTDTGRGMPPENQKLLFHKFQQAGTSTLTRDATEGTGLGLYISKLIVELSGGKIGLVSSEVGKGSTFSFSLPRARV